MPRKFTKPNQKTLTDSPNSLLLIFTRNPELGKCKTRLAATIGNESALKVYEFLLQHTAAVTRGVSATKRIYYSEEIWEDDLWSDPVFEKHLQEGIDLGARMHQAFKNGFEEGFEKIIIIGSDLYEKTKSFREYKFKNKGSFSADLKHPYPVFTIYRNE